MSARTAAPKPGVIRALSAAQAAELDERGIPKVLGTLTRAVQLSAYDKDKHTVELAVSSETAVDRYYAKEILQHDKGAIIADRLKRGIALLFNHDMDQHLGTSTGYDIGDDGVLRMTFRFGTGQLAQEKEADVASGVLKDTSIGYRVMQRDTVTNNKTGETTMTALKWEPYEVSLVTVPADPTVGVARNAKDAAPVHIRSFCIIEPAARSMTATKKRTRHPCRAIHALSTAFTSGG